MTHHHKHDSTQSCPVSRCSVSRDDDDSRQLNCLIAPFHAIITSYDLFHHNGALKHVPIHSKNTKHE